MSNKLEVRGVRCLDCKMLDLKKFPDASNLGWGSCTAAPRYVFARIEMSRNCAEFVRASAETVVLREMWVEKITIPAWQR